MSTLTDQEVHMGRRRKRRKRKAPPKMVDLPAANLRALAGGALGPKIAATARIALAKTERAAA